MSETSDPPAAPDATPHKRRPRYRGKNPRRFEEKYKEHDPARFPDLVAHVRASGKTPAGQHVPFMVAEILATLAIQPGQQGIDCTLGYGGHAERLLDAAGADGRLLAVDADPIESDKTRARLAALGLTEPRLTIRRTNFAGANGVLAELGWDGADFLLADLGLSSMQIDDPARGFSVKAHEDGPLDMRMNPRRGESAAAWLARVDTDELIRAMTENGDEPHAARIAAGLAKHRGRIETTAALARLIRESLPHGTLADDADLSVRRVFQAIRIEVNDEFGALDSLMRQLPTLLRGGGRAAILTFHSGEDRRVKKAFEVGLKAGMYAEISTDVVRASHDERRDNPRAAPAKLRWARRA
jgi:16S rRNA (cytosine1402-N4)-methyltransferase